MDYVLRLLRVLVMLGLWRQILAGHEVSGSTSAAVISRSAVLTYTVVSEVFAEQLSGRTTNWYWGANREKLVAYGG